MATTAQDIMTADPERLSEADTVQDAARKMRDLDVGSLPLCDAEGRITAILTDRDLVVRWVAEGGTDPGAMAGMFAEPDPVTVDADDAIEEVMSAMAENQVRRIPVVRDGILVGIISEADVAHGGRSGDVGDTVEAVTEP